MTRLLRNITALGVAAALWPGLDAHGRTLQYSPDSTAAIVCQEGYNLYTRALYGAHIPFRLETGDRPVFCAWTKPLRRNICFSIDGVRLDSTLCCTARYADGMRSYTLSDPQWGTVRIHIDAAVGKVRENAIFRITPEGWTNDAILTALCAPTKNIKFSRNGDLGVDNPQGYEADTSAQADSLATKCSISLVGMHHGESGNNNKPLYVEYADGKISATDQRRLAKEYRAAAEASAALASRISIDTPDPYINCLGPVLSLTGDAIWDGDTYLHGAIGWRMPLAGWRGAYTGDFLGCHDRARTHFDAYAASQVTDIEPKIPHPAQDSTLHMARAEKRWGTQMYSKGYICRNPHRNDQMHHYDMDLCYIDALLWHLQWTGDTTYAKQIWPVIANILAWEKRNYDPDDDGLYDAYCCIWASDALYYSGGAVTHSSALNHRANLLAAKVAELIGEDPEPYRNEARKILNALNTNLYMPDAGVWAEYRDLLGEKRLHTHPGLWTVYHAIDSECATPEQAYCATRHIDQNIPHLPVGEGEFADETVLSTTDWQPYSWSINNVAFAENYHTALAYWLAARPREATALLRAAVLDGMFLGQSPGNVGQISALDAARGECYRDFADPVGVLSRAVVQGLFGFTPRALDRRIDLRPGFPSEWDHASISHPDFSLLYSQVTEIPGIYPNNPPMRTDIYCLELTRQMASVADSIHWILPVLYSEPAVMMADGSKPADTHIEDAGTPYATLHFTVPAEEKSVAMIFWRGDKTIKDTTVSSTIADAPAPATGVIPPNNPGTCTPISLEGYYNARVTDIFRNSYLSPRPPYTTLQIPTQGIGEWCHPLDSAEIDDSALRREEIRTPGGIPFRMPPDGPNTIYTSLFDNYPDSVDIPLSGSGSGLALLMAGSTNHMQCHIANATLTVTYTDGSTDTLDLVPPLNWAPIEQDYYCDNGAFRLPAHRPLRLAMKTGQWSTRLGDEFELGSPDRRRIPGGAATVLYLPLQSDKKLKKLTLRTRAGDVVTGLLAATLVSESATETTQQTSKTIKNKQ